MWVSDKVIISDTNQEANYTAAEYKNLFASIKNSVLALGIMFFVPMFVTVVMGMLGDRTVFSSCWKHAEKPSAATNYIEPIEGRKKGTIIIDPKEYEKGVPKATQLEFT